MVDVTQQFLDEVYKTNRYVSIRGTLNNKGVITELTSEDFVVGTINKISKGVSNSNFQIGDVHIDYLNFSLGIRDNTFQNLIGSVVELEFGLEVSEGIHEWCSLGKYIINPDGVVRKSKVIAVTADSMLSKTDIPVNIVSSGSPYDLALWSCDKCGLVLATTVEEFESFANGSVNISIPDPNDYDGIKTYRDLLMWVASWTCTFVTCNTKGEVVFKPYAGVPVWELNPDTIKAKQFNDYVMNIQNVTMSVGENNYSVDEDVPLDNTLVLDENPFFITHVADALRLEALTAIRDELNKVQFVPYKIEFNGNPALEPGDWFSYKGNNYLITSSHFKLGGTHTLQGVGLKIGNTKKQSSTSKGGGGGSGSGSGSGGEAQYRTIRYTNVKELKVGSSRTKVMEFAFELGANISPMLTVLVNCKIVSEGFISLVLKYDNVDLIPVFNEYMPVGEKSFSFSFPLAPRDVAMTHILYGYIYSRDTAKGTISVENVIASLSAWGIASGMVEWDGSITINEEVPLFKLEPSNFRMGNIEDKVIITTDIPLPSVVIQNVPTMPLTLGGLSLLGVSENININITE